MILKVAQIEQTSGTIEIDKLQDNGRLIRNCRNIQTSLQFSLKHW